MKRAWTRGEKWLWATPLLIVICTGGVMFGPEVARRAAGWPQSLALAPGTNIRSMALSRNGEILAAGGFIQKPKGWKPGSGTIYLWNARTAEQLKPIAPVYTRDRTGFVDGFDIYALALSPEGKQIGFSRVGQNWALYDVATQKQLWSFSEFIADAEFSRDGRLIALSSGARISIISTADGKVRAQWKRSDPTNSRPIAFSPDATLIASIGPYKSGNPIELHRADTGKLVRRIQPVRTVSGEKIASVAFSPDNSQLIVAGSISSYGSEEDLSKFTPLRCYQVSTGKLLWEIKATMLGGTGFLHSAFCDAIFSPDGRVVAAYQYLNGRVFFLDSGTGEIKGNRHFGRNAHSTLSAPPGLAFSPDGKRLFARSKSSILFWDLEQE